MEQSRDYRKAYDELSEFLAKSHHIVLFGHKGPDGDSVGSTLAMRMLLESLGKSVQVIMAGGIPLNLRWMPGATEILQQGRQDEEIDKTLSLSDLIICLDFNALYRIGPLLEERLRATLAQRSIPVLMIDHHPYPSDEFSWQWSCPEAAATCEVLTRLFLSPDERWIHLPETTDSTPLDSAQAEALRAKIATSLLTGIITDTGLFNHNSSRPDLYELVAVLLRSGADKDLIVDKINHNHPESRQRLEGYILYEKVVVMPEIQSAYFVLTREEMERFETGAADTDGFVNKPLDIKGINCSAFFRETLDEGVKVSVRSIGDIAVNELCSECFGGGGHKNAAGGEFTQGSISEAVDLFVDYMRRHYLRPSKERKPAMGIPIPKELQEMFN